MPDEFTVMRALDAYQARVRDRAKPVLQLPASLEDFRHDHLVWSLDQSLSRTGWVMVQVDSSGVRVLDRGTLRISTELTSHEGTFDKAAKLEAQLAVLSAVCIADAVLLERPAVHGQRTESSLLAAYVVLQVDRGARMVSIQHARRILGGPQARDDKKLGHQALARYIPESASRKWNEHQRDAAINALGYLYDSKESGHVSSGQC